MKKLNAIAFIPMVFSVVISQALPTTKSIDELKQVVEYAARNDYRVLVEEFTGFL